MVSTLSFFRALLSSLVVCYFFCFGTSHAANCARSKIDLEWSLKNTLAEMTIAANTDEVLYYDFSLTIDLDNNNITINGPYVALVFQSRDQLLFVGIPEALLEEFISAVSSKEALLTFMTGWNMYEYATADESGLLFLLRHPASNQVIYWANSEHLSPAILAAVNSSSDSQ